MLRRFGVVFLILSSIVLAHFYGHFSYYRYLPWVALAVSGTLLLISLHNQSAFILAAIFYSILALSQFGRVRLDFILAQHITIIAVVGLWIYFVRGSDRKVMAAELQKSNVVEGIRLLREKYDARLDSLNHLERQVSGLLDLFEIAKDFNECLYFDQLISTLDRRAREQMSFKALTLTLLTTFQDREDVVTRTMSIEKPNEENLKLRDPGAYDKFCLNQAKINSQPVKFDSLESLKGVYAPENPVTFPLWIFPLRIDGKLMSVLTIEGASEDHFPKFELLASQLALQVRKIGLYERVKELSIIDGLTKTYVRRHFLERFEEELKRAVKRKMPISVLMLDIDHFKSYNDNFGHLVGDSTLREVAQVIRDSIRKVDLLARYGGEEFIIAMPDVGYTTNVEGAERIRSAVARKSFRLYDEETKVTISIGVSCFPDDAEAANLKNFDSSLILNLIQKADRALYTAKEEGRNRVVSYRQIKSR